MDFSLFSDLLRNLLHVQVFYTGGDDAVFQRFQEKYCYNSALQPSFTAETLSRLTEEAQENTLYGLQDDLGVCLIFFKLDGSRFLVGPFVRSEFNENKLHPVLMAHHIPGSYAASVRLYYSAFPLVSSTHVRNTVVACIHAMSSTATTVIATMMAIIATMNRSNFLRFDSSAHTFAIFTSRGL